MWVDEDKLVRRMTSKSTIPAQNGVPEGRYEMTMDFDDFGTPLTIQPPASGDVWDATDSITKALKVGRPAAGRDDDRLARRSLHRRGRAARGRR